MNEFGDSMSWRQEGKPNHHICNCIGCCKKCGMCRTSPKHTSDYCALLVRQKAEREEFWNHHVSPQSRGAFLRKWRDSR